MHKLEYEIECFQLDVRYRIWAMKPENKLAQRDYTGLLKLALYKVTVEWYWSKIS